MCIISLQGVSGIDFVFSLSSTRGISAGSLYFKWCRWVSPSHVKTARIFFCSLANIKTDIDAKVCTWHVNYSTVEYVNKKVNKYWHGPLTRYVKLRVAHAPGMPGTFSPPPRVSDPDMHHRTCVTHVPRCMPGSLTSGFLTSQWRHFWRMRNL